MTISIFLEQPVWVAEILFTTTQRGNAANPTSSKES
jgi:hypothetical protein